MQIGLVCNITGKIADFDNECKSYELDDTIVEKLDDTQAVEHQDALYKLSDKHIEKFKLEQNYRRALIGSIVVGVIGAILWAAITVATEYQIGYMAIAIGAGVGLSMRFLGKGIDQIFGITGAIVAVISCLLGNFFGIIGFVANLENLGYIETLGMFDYSQLIPIMSEAFSPIDLLFYGIAGFEGYKLAFRKFTEKELHQLEN